MLHPIPSHDSTGATAQVPWTPLLRLGLCALLVLATACGSPPGDRLVGARDEELPAMSLYCPEGASVQECIQFERVLEHLRRSTNPVCRQTADIIYDQMHNSNNNDVGVYNQDQSGTLAGGSAYDYANNRFFNYTILFPRAYVSDNELAWTLTHEAYGHQYLNNHDEVIAELSQYACGTEN